jgi:hypothetical protein
VKLSVALFALLVFCGAVFGQNHHPYFWWDRIPGFAAALGLAGSWLLTLLAKSLLAPFLQRPDESGED